MNAILENQHGGQQYPPSSFFSRNQPTPNSPYFESSYNGKAGQTFSTSIDINGNSAYIYKQDIEQSNLEQSMNESMIRAELYKVKY